MRQERFVRRATALVVTAALANFGGTAQAQGAPAVATAAPDFTSSGATRYGALDAPVRLSDFQGKTVVLAFFPKARTKGCTVQMQSYRDQYESLFNGGKDVVVMGISADPDSALVNWAQEEDFPMLFVSDVGGKVGSLYGAYDAKGKYDKRALFIVAPDGRITYTVPSFNVLSTDAYAELASEVEKARATKAAAGTHSGH
jgi:peroxiredoxin Q/BCP